MAKCRVTTFALALSTLPYCLRLFNLHGPHQASIRVQHPQEPQRVSSRVRRRQQCRNGRVGQGLEAGHCSRYGSYLSHTSLSRLDRFRHNLLDLVESPVVAIDADESVEVACDVRGLCVCRVCRSRVYIGSLGPPVIYRPLFGHPSKGFILSRLI